MLFSAAHDVDAALLPAYQGGDIGNFANHFGDELLPAEAGVDGHHQNHVRLRNQFLDRLNRRSGVERDSGFHFHLPNRAEQAVRMADGFGVKGERGGARLGEGRGEGFGVFGHQVDIQKRAGQRAAKGGAQRGAEGQVRDKLIVHHIQMQPVRPGGEGALGVLAEAGEVCGKQGGCDDGFFHGGNFAFCAGGNYTTEMTEKIASAETRKHGAHAIVRVRPRHAPEIMVAGGGEYCFAYAVEIENAGGLAFRLLARRWTITDDDGKVREIAGPGVIGKQPLILPGGIHRYESFVDLPTAVGFMRGAYLMRLEDGREFEAEIPQFVLHAPGSLH